MGKKPSLLEHIQQKTANPIATAAHARALMPHLTALVSQPIFDEETIEATSDVLDAMQRVTDPEAGAVLRQDALPQMIALFDRVRHDVAWDSQLLFFLKIFGLYGGADAITRIIAAARDGLQPDGFLWSTICGELAEAPADAEQVLTALTSPLPDGFIAVALLDLANTMWRRAPETKHAFDSEAGRARLRVYLSSTDPEEWSYAHSAAAALAALDGQDATELLLLADGHADLNVRMEAAWVRARRNDETAVTALSTWAADPRTGRRAVEYLRELNRLDAVPSVVNTLDYFALAEMSAWLAHPLEFGQPPDAVTVVDHRRIFWPPTNDERDMWLVRYRYDDPGDPTEGIGCVGSVTFALFGEATAEHDVEDLYGLYCCWELEQAGDERAPKHRSALAGRKLLGFKKKK